MCFPQHNPAEVCFAFLGFLSESDWEVQSRDSVLIKEEETVLELAIEHNNPLLAALQLA